jgi:hypothetical protein
MMAETAFFWHTEKRIHALPWFGGTVQGIPVGVRGSYGYGRYEQTILLSGGASWIRNMGKELFPDALRILDFCHLAENIYSFGKYFFQGMRSGI